MSNEQEKHLNALQLRNILNEYSDEALESLTVTVQTMGALGGFSNVKIHSPYVGFDYEKGQMVFLPSRSITPFRGIDQSRIEQVRMDD
jgi:hypothetical protein